MRAEHLQDRISRGLGTAARHIGLSYDAYRPSGPSAPLAASNRYLRLSAAFNAENPQFQRPSGYGRATWFAVLDSAYTKPGDYLVGPGGTFFIAAQQSLLPILCVQTNRTVTISRPAAPGGIGMNTYGGVTRATILSLLTAWPASILATGGGSAGDLPGDSRLPWWSILLPAAPATLRPADLVQDDLGRTHVNASAELTDLGWRLTAKQAAT